MKTGLILDRKTWRNSLLLAVATIFAAGITAISFRYLSIASVVIAGPVVGALAIFALVSIIQVIVLAWNERSRGLRAIINAIVPIGVTMGLVLMFLPLSWLFLAVLDWATLAINWSRYSTIAAAPQSHHEQADVWLKAHGTDYVLAHGSPRRVAFPMPGGFLDNWDAIVVDPTDRVAAATGLTREGDFTAPSDVKSLFGGDLVACTHMTGHFYRCSFT